MWRAVRHTPVLKKKKYVAVSGMHHACCTSWRRFTVDEWCEYQRHKTQEMVHRCLSGGYAQHETLHMATFFKSFVWTRRSFPSALKCDRHVVFFLFWSLSHNWSQPPATQIIDTTQPWISGFKPILLPAPTKTFFSNFVQLIVSSIIGQVKNKCQGHNSGKQKMYNLFFFFLTSHSII